MPKALKDGLIRVLLLLFFMILFLVLAALAGSTNPSETMYHVFAIIGMLHWIDKELLKD